VLILSRRLNEVINIGTDISVKVIRISRDAVKLGIDAPEDVTVHRQEVTRRIEEKVQHDHGEPEE